jgi:glycosyltransferase involved in cell wall biosynthesis
MSTPPAPKASASVSARATRPLPVSICTITHNEENLLPGYFASVLDYAAEVVILNAGSTDGTAGVLRQYAAQHHEIKVLEAENTLNYNVNKMKTFAAATQPWLFYLDPDEQMTPELWQEIAEVLKSSEFAGYQVGRKNFYFGRWMRYGGMYPEKQPRFFRKGQGTFSMRHVHESLEIKGKVGELREPFLHYSYQNVSQFLHKLDNYTTFQARLWHSQKIRWGGKNHLTYGLLRPFLRFGQKYVLMSGYRDGFWGFFAAWMSGVSEFIAYCKLRDEERGAGDRRA